MNLRDGISLRIFPSEVVQQASGNAWPVIQELAGKPCPYLVKTYDTPRGTDYNADYAWHVFDKEKRWELPWTGMLGAINPNTDIGLILGIGIHQQPARFDWPFHPLVHLSDLIVYKIDLGSELSSEVMFYCYDSNTLVASFHVVNKSRANVFLSIRDCLVKRRNGNPPKLRWKLEGQLHGAGVTTATGNLCRRWRSRDPLCRQMSFYEWLNGQAEATRLLVTLKGGYPTGLMDTMGSADDKASLPEGCMDSLLVNLEIPAGENAAFGAALNLHRFAEAEIDNPARTPLLYPHESQKDARYNGLVSCEAALEAQWRMNLYESTVAYCEFPQIHLPEKQWNRDFYACLELPRASTFTGYNHIETPFYNFCRVHAHDPFGWWSYGMHAHENLSTLFNSIVNPDLSAEFLRGHFQFQMKDGMYPYGVSHYEEPIHTGQATAPLIVWEAWNGYLWSGDREFLREAFESGKRNHDWWLKNRSRNGDGLCHWLNVSNESVRDDDGLATWQSTEGSQNQAALDLNCYLLMQEKALAAMAAELNQAEDSRHYMELAKRRAEIMNERMWHEEDGCYYGIREDKPGWARVKDISTFFPLWAGLAPKERIDTIVALLDDPETFGLPFGPPVLAKNEPGWGPQKHWQGANWVEMSLFPILGLRAYGYYNKAAELAYRNTKMVFDELEKYGHFREYFNSMTGQGTDLIDYIWTAMPAWFIVHVFFGIEPLPDGIQILPALPQDWPEIQIRDLRFRGKRIFLTVKRMKQMTSAKVLWGGAEVPALENRGLFVPWDRLQDEAHIEVIHPW